MSSTTMDSIRRSTTSYNQYDWGGIDWERRLSNIQIYEEEKVNKTVNFIVSEKR